MDQQLNQIAQLARQLAQGERSNEQTLKQLSQQVRDQQHSQQLESLANAENSAYTQLERIATLCDEALRSSQTGSGSGTGSSLQSSTGTGMGSSFQSSTGAGSQFSSTSSHSGVNQLMRETDSTSHSSR